MLSLGNNNHISSPWNAVVALLQVIIRLPEFTQSTHLEKKHVIRPEGIQVSDYSKRRKGNHLLSSVLLCPPVTLP